MSRRRKGPKQETPTQVIQRITREAASMSGDDGRLHVERFNDEVNRLRLSLGVGKNEAVLQVVDNFPPLFADESVDEEGAPTGSYGTASPPAGRGSFDFKYEDFYQKDGTPKFKQMSLPRQIRWVADHAALIDLCPELIPHPAVIPVLRVAREDPLEFARSFLMKIMPSQRAIDAMGNQDDDCEADLKYLDELDRYANKINGIADDQVPVSVLCEVVEIALDESLQQTERLDAIVRFVQKVTKSQEAVL